MKDKFLPIGTVVMLKKGNKKVMINAYGVFSTDKVFNNGKEIPRKKELFEYGGCTYPEGVLDPNMICAFNHGDIEKIYHMGFSSPEYDEFITKLQKNYDNYKDKFATK